MSNQNDLLIKKIDDLEKSSTFNKERSSNQSGNNKSISTKNTDNNNNNSADLSYDLFNHKEIFADIELKKDFEEKITKINKKYDLISKNFDDLEKKCDTNNSEINSIKNSLEEINNLHLFYSKKIENFGKFEKLISELLNQINNMKTNNSAWQADFLKNMNFFNEKIMNQEILLDQLEKFEKLSNTKIDYVVTEINKLPSIYDDKIEEVSFFNDGFKKKIFLNFLN